MSDFDSSIAQVSKYLQSLQQNIVHALEDTDGKASFLRDEWEREGGGGGLSRILTDGAVFEQAGVGYSHVYGEELPDRDARRDQCPVLD